MNSHFNSALKQTSSLTRDLALFSNPATAASPALQGQISASLASLTRTLDDYETLAKRELISAKKEKAETRLREFRAQLDEFRREFARVREEREAVEHTVARSELLGRRGHSSATPENPYARAPPVPRSNPFAPAGGGGSGEGVSVAASVEEQHFREGDFFVTDGHAAGRVPRSREGGVAGPDGAEERAEKHAKEALLGCEHARGERQYH